LADGDLAKSSLFYGALDGSTSVMQLLGSPLLGILADRFVVVVVALDEVRRVARPST
jgi:hypothetical protein